MSIFKPSLLRTVLFCLLAGCVIVAGSASVVKSMGYMITPIKQLEQSLGGAIYLHALIAIILGSIAQLTAPSPWRTLPLGLSITIIPLCALVALDEALQYFIPIRHFEWLDMAVNVFGVVSGALFIAVSHKLFRQFRPVAQATR